MKTCLYKFINNMDNKEDFVGVIFSNEQTVYTIFLTKYT